MRALVVALSAGLVLGCVPKTLVHFEQPAPLSGPVVVKLEPVRCLFERGNATAELPELHEPFRFSLTNNTTEWLTVNWDRSFFVDEKNLSHRLVHEGDEWQERDEKEQMPTAVPPGATITDAVYPADAIDEPGAGFRMLPFLSCQPAAVGRGYRLTFSYKAADQEAHVDVHFRVREVSKL